MKEEWKRLCEEKRLEEEREENRSEAERVEKRLEAKQEEKRWEAEREEKPIFRLHVHSTDVFKRKKQNRVNKEITIRGGRKKSINNPGKSCNEANHDLFIENGRKQLNEIFTPRKIWLTKFKS